MPSTPCKNHSFSELRSYKIGTITPEKLAGYCQNCNLWFVVSNSNPPKALCAISEFIVKRYLETQPSSVLA